ncbi:pirin family protein, partial [Alkalihalophilus pseudofirmus]|nr:pirin family protein [Alkalihalophilus pseudofirmus]
LELEQDKEIIFAVAEGRQAYLVQVEGVSNVNNIELGTRDAIEIVEEDLVIKASEHSHVVILEMKKMD